jgi:Pentapeptide repeats (8 copies)
MSIISVQGASSSGISIWVPVIAAIVGAVAAIAVAVPNYLLQRRQLEEQRQLFERQHDEQKEQFVRQLDQTREQLNILRSGQTTDRYTKAVDQLGKGAGEVCLGGIYALGSIMREHPDYEEPVIAVLSSFVRRKGKVSDDGKIPWTPSEAERDEAKPSFAIQAALDVIGQPRSKDSRAQPNLRDSDLRGARLHGADLRDASLRRSCLWKAHLQGADLRWASLNRADLTEARLAGVKFEGADLKGARLTRDSLTPEQLAEAKNGDQIVLINPDLTNTNLPHTHPWVSS